MGGGERKGHWARTTVGDSEGGESILVLFVTWWWAGNIGERRRIGGGLLGVQVFERREVTRRKRTQLLEGGPLLEGGSLLEGGLLLEGGSLLETLFEGESILDRCAWNHLEQPEGRGAHPPAEGARKAREAAFLQCGVQGDYKLSGAAAVGTKLPCTPCSALPVLTTGAAAGAVRTAPCGACGE